MDNALLIVVTLCVLLLTALRPSLAASVILALTPAYLLRFSFGPLPTTVLEIMALAFLAVRAVQFVHARALPPLPARWRALGLLFLLAGTLAVLPSPDLRAALGLWKAYVAEPVLFAWFCADLFRTRERRRLLLAGFGALALLIAASVFLQLLGALGVPEPYANETPRRLTGFFPFPTAVGKALAPILALAAGIFFARRASWKSASRPAYAAALVFLVGAAALLLSVSRGALLGLAAAMLVAVTVRWGARIGIGLAALLIVVTFAVSPLRNEVRGVIAGRDVSADVHRVLWRGTARLIAAHPITGAGLAGFPLLYPMYKEASHVESFPNPDNLYLTAWVEMGLLGLLVWLALLGVALRRAFLLARLAVHPEDRALALGLLAALIAVIVHGFVDTPYFKNDLAVQFWMLLALLVSLDETGQNVERVV